jgi:hypothetical protein
MNPEETFGMLCEAIEQSEEARDRLREIAVEVGAVAGLAGVATEVIQNVMGMVRAVDPNGHYDETRRAMNAASAVRTQADLILETARGLDDAVNTGTVGADEVAEVLGNLRDRLA